MRAPGREPSVAAIDALTHVVHGLAKKMDWTTFVMRSALAVASVTA